jgi:hypothetical protein
MQLEREKKLIFARRAVDHFSDVVKRESEGGGSYPDLGRDLLRALAR